MSKGRDLKPHIGLFGRRNNGKSSLINTLTGQDIAIVSDMPGTTTDPVKKSIEIFGIGPAVLIDTAGIDDEGDLGNKRIQKTLDVIKIIDCAVLVLTSNFFGVHEKNLIDLFNEYHLPFFILHNKCDKEPLTQILKNYLTEEYKTAVVDFSVVNSLNLDLVIDTLKKTIPETSYQNTSLFDGLIEKNDIVILVTPIDSEAPDGRMILPQVMAIRDVLDHDCINIVLKETELEYFLKETKIKPKLVVTDSQAFAKISQIVPEDIQLTGFSVLLAKLRGDFNAYRNGTLKISELKDGDKILIMESCTHRISCDDIGRFKIPRWLKEFSGKNLEFEFVSGLGNTQSPIQSYALVIQCGGCVFTKKQVVSRLKPAIDAGIPVTNYGLAIAYMNGIFERALEPFNI